MITLHYCPKCSSLYDKPGHHVCPQPCPKCNGTGYEDDREDEDCPECDGSGWKGIG